MKIKLITFVLLLSFCISFGQSDSFRNNSVIVKLRPENNNKSLSPIDKLSQGVLAQIRTLHPISEVKITGVRAADDTYAIYFTDSQDIPALVASYKQTGFFVYVEPNYTGSAAGQSFEVNGTLPDDTFFSRQWGLNNDGTLPITDAEVGVDIKMEDAWAIEQGDASTIIAVIDSGVKLDHPELAGRIWTNDAEVADGIDNDGNGYIDDINGWNFAYSTNDVSDDIGHGSNIAGILASNQNNANGYAGINWNCKIMNIKMLDSNNAFADITWAIDAVQYAIDNGATVINMSWGTTGNSSALQDVIEDALASNIVMTASMMNTDNNVIFYPAAYSETIAVGAIDPDGDRSSPFPWSTSSGSNFGAHIDLIAPGNYTYGITYNSDTNFNTFWAGTSQAAPHVAGIASLLLAQNPQLDPEAIRTILLDTADDQTGDPAEDTPGFDIYYGSGRLNAFAALSSLLTVEESNLLANTIYPNPVTKNKAVSVQFETPFNGDFQLYSVTGRLVKEWEINDLVTEVTLQMPSLTSGIYYLKMISNSNQFSTTQKLIITD